MTDLYDNHLLSLYRNPRVIRIADNLKMDVFAVVGRICAIISWMHEQDIEAGEDDYGYCVKFEWLDHLVNHPGFAAALLQEGLIKGEDCKVKFAMFPFYLER